MKITPGAIRFNTDSMKLEYYHLGSVGFGTLAAGEWVQLTTDTPEFRLVELVVCLWVDTALPPIQLIM